MKTVEFELGTIDPREWKFDHHQAINESNAFIAKMASVQLIEALIIKGEIEEFSIDNVKLNHVGHLDDFVLHAIPYAQAARKLRGLYSFACRISALDSLGPGAYQLIENKDREIVNNIYSKFQEEVKIIANNKNVERWDLSTEDKTPASKMAGKLLIDSINVDKYTKPEIWVPEKEHYNIITKRDDNIWLIKIIDSTLSPLRASAYFYSQGCKVLVAYSFRTRIDRWSYSICSRSAYDFDLSPLWDKLNKIETAPGKWGGHSGAGGSPRQNNNFDGGSNIEPKIILGSI